MDHFVLHSLLHRAPPVFEHRSENTFLTLLTQPLNTKTVVVLAQNGQIFVIR